MKNLIWIASYPKSGNTWIRILLESILLHKGEEVDFNNLELVQSGDIRRDEFNYFLGFDSSDLSLEESWRYKRLYFEQKSLLSKKELFIKIHDSNLKLKDGSDLIPQRGTKTVIYIVRNPLSIVSSLANHYGISKDTSIARMNSKGFIDLNINEPFYNTALYSEMDTWSNNVSSWLGSSSFPVQLIRYEDLHQQPIEILTNLLKSLNRNDCIQYISKAIENSSFSKLATKEQQNGFSEASLLSKQFYRKGKVDSWKKELNDKQIAKVIADHGTVMKKLNY